MTQAAVLGRGVDFRVDSLDEYLNGWLGGVEPVRVQRTQGGMSGAPFT